MTKVTQIRSLLHICCCFVTHVNLFFRPVRTPLRVIAARCKMTVMRNL